MQMTGDDIVGLAAQHGLSLSPDTVVLEASGADFLAAFANDTSGVPWVLRMPRRPDVLPRAASEGRALKLIGPRVPVATPDWRINTPELIAYPRLSGVPATVEEGEYVWHVDAKPPHRAFVTSLGEALAALHAISQDDVIAAGLTVLSPAAACEATAEKIRQAKRIVDVPGSVAASWEAWLADDDRWPPRTALIHGDLHPGHLLLNEHGVVTGIIDWTEAEINDPAIDFAFVHWMFGRETLAELLDVYAQAGGPIWPRMAEQVAARWSYAPAMIAVFAEQSGHPEYLEHARALLAAQDAELQRA